MEVKAVLGLARDKQSFFNVESGVRQRDSLSPLLFIIVLEYMIRKVERTGSGMEWVGGRRLRDLAYADDVCLLSENVEDMRRLPEALVEEAGKVGVKVNTNMTGIMKNRTTDASQVHIDEAALQ